MHAYDRFFEIFFDKVHPSFPFMDRTEWINEHINCFDTGQLLPTSDNCLALLVVSLASLAEDWNIGISQPLVSMDCMLAAQIMLPTVIFGHDITAVHCLLLFGIYYIWVVHPPQAFNFISMAALKAQFLLFRYLSSFNRTLMAEKHGTFPCLKMKWPYVGLTSSVISLKSNHIRKSADFSDLRRQSMNPGTRLDEFEKLIQPTKISNSDQDLYLINEYNIRLILNRATAIRVGTLLFPSFLI